MSHAATQAFQTAIEELQVNVASVEAALANPTSGVCLSGSQILDIHYQLISLSERLLRCGRTIPPVESDEAQDRLIAKWEQGGGESPELAWSHGTMISEGD